MWLNVPALWIKISAECVSVRTPSIPTSEQLITLLFRAVVILLTNIDDTNGVAAVSDILEIWKRVEFISSGTTWLATPRAETSREFDLWETVTLHSRNWLPLVLQFKVKSISGHTYATSEGDSTRVPVCNKLQIMVLTRNVNYSYMYTSLSDWDLSCSCSCIKRLVTFCKFVAHKKYEANPYFHSSLVRRRGSYVLPFFYTQF